MTNFGTFITRGDVEQAVLHHLQSWFPLWLAEVERQQSIEPKSLQMPRSWAVVTESVRFPEDRLPWIAVVSAGINPGRAPRREGDGDITADWLIVVGAIVSARDADSAKALAGFYAAAIRGVMIQKGSIGDFANATDWTDESYTEIGRVQEANLAGVRLTFNLEVRGVMNTYKGFKGTTPPADPYEAIEPNPTMTDIEIDIEKIPDTTIRFRVVTAVHGTLTVI